MPPATLTAAAERVARYREADARRFTPDTDGLRAGYTDRMSVVTANMLAALEEGSETEASVWATYGLVVADRFRLAWQ
jgi:hypothetical protein